MDFFAGVDTHRHTHCIYVINRLGEALDSFTIETTPKGFAQALERTEKYEGLIWGLEGTGSYGRTFARALVQNGQIVYEVPGTITKRHRRSLRGVGKSDPQDAHAIAEAVLRERNQLPRFLDSDAEEAVRLLYERRDRLVRERTVKVNRIRALALRLQLDLPADLTTARASKELAKLLEAPQIIGYADFEALDELRELAQELERFIQRVAELEERIRPFVERLAPELLKVRGCSAVSAAGMIGHAGAMSSYRNADAFASHAGTAPVQCSSGKYQSVRLSTGGNRQLNRCLHTIATVQSRTHGHQGKIYYDRKRAEGKTHREAMRCLKRRLAGVIFRLLVAAQARGGVLPAAAAA